MKPVPSDKTLAIIPSAGMGRRMGSVKKNYLPLAGRPVLARTIEVFEACPLVDAIALVVPESDKEYCRAEIVERYGFKKVVRIVAGGAERQDSVANGLKCAEGYGVVVVHDGARPLVGAAMIEGAIKAARELGAAVCAVPVKDTIKEAAGGEVKRTVPRESLWAVQTPQAFRAGVIIEAHEKALREGHKGTDESSLVERAGGRVAIVAGSYENIKITTKEDLALAECILRERAGGREMS